MNDQGNSSGSPIPPNGWGNQGATPQQSDTATKKAPSLLKTFLVAFGGAAVACALYWASIPLFTPLLLRCWGAVALGRTSR